MKLKMTLAVAALLTIGLSSVAAFADTVTFTLTSDYASIDWRTGGTATFDATVSAPLTNSADVFLNGDSFNIQSPLTLDDSDFFADFPFFLAPGDSFTGALFAVTMPPNTPLGIYLGTFTLLGGPNGGSSNVLGTVSFSVAAAPEPSSIVMMLTGLAGLAMFLFGARFRANLHAVAR